MDQFGISDLADWLEAHSTALLEKKEAMPVDRVFAAVDQLGVLQQPAAHYLSVRQGQYFQNESDHKLNLLADDQPLSALEDRIMVNHVDGSITEDTLNFTYNHEPVFDGTYSPKKDLNIVKFGLEVVGAAASTGDDDTLADVLSHDALVTFIVAAQAFADWQKA
ncbi:hypothetical protein [Lacticaseibacillus mingshuiensis]|uniref:hypothetical protein n=1 Tax=Lacticaseibacillus mingshuiensis TaxID=2799574 RepID=UPI001951CBCC|nr:hypothetical protein [Lacticaseibacillus mingshuiensis]